MYRKMIRDIRSQSFDVRAIYSRSRFSCRGSIRQTHCISDQAVVPTYMSVQDSEYSRLLLKYRNFHMIRNSHTTHLRLMGRHCWYRNTSQALSPLVVSPHVCVHPALLPADV